MPVHALRETRITWKFRAWHSARPLLSDFPSKFSHRIESSSKNSNSGGKSPFKGERTLTCDEVLVAHITDAGDGGSEYCEKQEQGPCRQWVWILDGRRGSNVFPNV